MDNYDVAVLITGDADYIPVIEEVKRLGKVVFLAFFEKNGLSPKLKIAVDGFWECEQPFIESWQKFLNPPEVAAAQNA